MNVDELFKQRPYLFPNPVPAIEDRVTIEVGEQVKILVGIREEEKLVSGRWVIVDSRREESGSVHFVGKSIRGYGDDLVFEFQPENVHRIEPRLFTLWGANGIPRAMRGQASNDSAFHPPLDHHEKVLAEYFEVILRFRANGFLAARVHYERLAIQYPDWPKLDDLE